MPDDIQLLNFKSLDRALKTLPGKVAGKVIRSATLSGAGIIRKEARRRVSVDDGTLKKSISSKLKDKSDTHVTYSVGPTNKAFYGTFLEFGTEHIRPQPFLRPAFDEKKNEAAKKIEERLMKGIEKEAEKIRNVG